MWCTVITQAGVYLSPECYLYTVHAYNAVCTFHWFTEILLSTMDSQILDIGIGGTSTLLLCYHNENKTAHHRQDLADALHAAVLRRHNHGNNAAF